MEQRLYKISSELGITLLSVGHRNSLKKFHEMLLVVDDQHNWVLSKNSDLALDENNDESENEDNNENNNNTNTKKNKKREKKEQ